MSEVPHYWVGSRSAYAKDRAKYVPITDPVDLIAYHLCEPGWRGHFCSDSSARFEYRKRVERILAHFDVTPKGPTA